MTSIPLPTLIGDLRRVAEQLTILLSVLRRVADELTKLLGGFSQLAQGLGEEDLFGRGRVGAQTNQEDKTEGLPLEGKIIGELSRIVKGLKDVTMRNGQQDEDQNQEDKNENLRLEGLDLNDLSELVKRLEEATMPDGQQEDKNREDRRASPDDKRPDGKKMGDMNELVIKTDGQIESVLVSVGGEKNVALKLARLKVTPQPGGRTRMNLTATNETLLQALGSLQAAMEPTGEKPDYRS